MLEWLFTLIGVPFPFFQVVPVKDIKEIDPKSIGQAVDFIEMRCRDGFSMAAVMLLAEIRAPWHVASALSLGPAAATSARPLHEQPGRGRLVGWACRQIS